MESPHQMKPKGLESIVVAIASKHKVNTLMLCLSTDILASSGKTTLVAT